MSESNNRFKKVIRFYQLLPSEILNKAIESIHANRDLRRRLGKLKTNNDRVEALLSPLLRSMFVDSVYNVIKENVSLTLSEAKYEDILNAFTDDNKFFVAAFFFRWCYENGHDGLSNDEKYYDTFYDSELFDCIISGKSLVINEKTIDTVEDDITSSNNEEPLDDNNDYEENKMKLIGRIEKRNTYYNFFPHYEFVDEKLIEIPSDRLKTDYPPNGGINLFYTPYSGAADAFLKGIPTDTPSDKYVKNAYVAEINNAELEKNTNDDYKLRLNLQKIVQDGHDLHAVIQPVNDYHLYKVVTSETDTIPDNTFISGNIVIVQNNINEEEQVVLYYNDEYYGPFKVQCRKYDNTFYIKSGAIENNYLVPLISKDSIEKIDLEKTAQYDNPTYTRYIHLKGKTQWADFISDEVLLKKIKDDISIDLAIDNPEEFFHLCSNSPFLAKLPQDIIDNRIERLQDIISDVDKLKDMKHEVFESLLKIYQTSPSEISDKIISESEAYRTLKEKYNEERRRNENADKQIQDLRREYDELSHKLDENSKNNENAISSEKYIELQDEIDKLQEELSKEKEVSAVSASITELKEEQEKLKHNNEFLNSQAKEYEDRIKTARNEISKAIETSASDMASLAFDPFISSEMMKKAASWDSENEEKEYEKIKSNLDSITPSNLCGEDLVNYIVNYVKERREYSRNEIINVYISIAQNFITIFSGEPGTGKTSMCNIIAETLGLLRYGENLNRFVSVSVERGWASKRDFIGYYNPLTRRYDKSNSKVYDALRILDTERDSSKYPFVIMLDEANLSPMEYYWADFMRLTDRSSQNDMSINIGTDRELFVPETLRFVATINTDQTTELLSPRLIDRACIIKLPKTEPKQNNDSITSGVEIISWVNFIEAFSKKTELNGVTLKAIKEIYKLFNDYGMNVSPRIQTGVKQYVMAAQEIMEDESNVLAREKALDFAIIQKLMPKINGDYSLYEHFFDSLKQLCEEYNLYMTKEAITRIIDDQERNMGYCQYLI